MAKEATNLKPSKQVEQYCLTGHKNTRESTFECMGAEKQTAERSDFIIFYLFSHTKLLTGIAYKLKQLLNYFTPEQHHLYHSSPFQPVCL